MRYYNILPASQRFHGVEALTYSYNGGLEIGSVVKIQLRIEQTIGIVVEIIKKPSFKVKNIIEPIDVKALPKTSIDLLKWLINYYPAPLGSITSQFIPNNLKNRDVVSKASSKRLPNAKELPPLTAQQKQVLSKIKQPGSYLLHGDTGTGKTRIYTDLAKQQIKRGRSVLVLTPEIGLTPQLVRDFSQIFGSKVIAIHSNLTPRERQESWLKVLGSKQPLIVVGPRSALFAPFDNLGLIVVDEAHDSAYKQEQAPYYQALRVAGHLAQIHKSILVVGSATPNIADYYVAEAKNTPLLRMTELAVKNDIQEAKVEIIDSRNRDLFTRSSNISNLLLDSIDKAISYNKQALIFLNRRGTARLVMCVNCGWTALCPNCDLPLTYHADHHSMRCHTCGFSTKVPHKCPVCSSLDIIYKSPGTKSVVDELIRLFPKAKIMRFDTDNKKAERFERHYAAIKSGDVDIIVGTQLITKGLDLPRLALVGVLAADSSLSFPDYSAEERTFQQLSQILGRVGRGHTAGTAIIQSYHPDSPIIKAAINKDWAGFYKNQIKERQQFVFPPFCYLLKLDVRRKSIISAQSSANNLATQLKKLHLKIQIIGPTPSFYEKSKQGYSWQIILKSKDRSQLLEVIKNLPNGWSYNLDPNNLL